jgi:glutamate 5-kinase
MLEHCQIVVKLGTAALTKGTLNLSRSQMQQMVEQIAKLHAQGKKLIVISSGAVAAGRELMPRSKEDGFVPSKQMLAAVGQVQLMRVWTELFAQYNIIVGQVLLTRGDFSNRQRYLNVRDTFLSMLHHRIIPIVNENDTVVIHETRVGDNDNLSALVANMVAADLLILLTDQKGLYTQDPRTHKDAALIEEVARIDDSVFSLAKGSSSQLGTGGMYTKVEAALLATQSGTQTVIASYEEKRVLERLAAKERVGTLFLAQTSWRESRKRWLLSEKIQGTLQVDQGAADKLSHHGASLLAAGIVKTSHPFERGATVRIVDPEQKPIAVGLSNYTSEEIAQLIGVHSGEIESKLGYSWGSEIVHRDNMTLIKKNQS